MMKKTFFVVALSLLSAQAGFATEWHVLGARAMGIPAESFIGKLFRDNPLGQSDEMTPFCIVRKVSSTGE